METVRISFFLFIFLVALLDYANAVRYWQQQRNPFTSGIPPNAGMFEEPINHIGSDLNQLARRRGSIQQTMIQPFQPPLMASAMANPPAAIEAAEEQRNRRLGQRRAGNFGGRLGGDILDRPPVSDGGAPPMEMVEQDLARLAARHAEPENQKFGPTADIIRAASIQPTNDFGARAPASMPFVPQDGLLAGRRAAPEPEEGGPGGPPPVTSPITENADAAPYLYNVFNNVGFLNSRRRRLRGRSTPMTLLGGRRDVLPWFRNDVNERGNLQLRERSFMPSDAGRSQMLLGRGGAGYGLGGAQAYSQPNSIAPVSYPVPDLYRACGFGGDGGGSSGNCPYIYSGAHVAETVVPLGNGYGGGGGGYNNNINLGEYGGPNTNINMNNNYGGNGGGGGGYGSLNRRRSNSYNNNNNNQNHGSRRLTTYLSGKSNVKQQKIAAQHNKEKVQEQQQPAESKTHSIINFPQTVNHTEAAEPTTMIRQQLNLHKKQKMSNKRRQVSVSSGEKKERSRYGTLIARLDRTVRRKSQAGGPKLAFDMPRYNFRDILCPAFNNDVVGSVRASLVDQGRRVKNGESYFLRYSLPNFSEGGLKIDPISGDISVAAELSKNGRFSMKFGDPPLVLTVLVSLNKLSGEKFAQIFVPVAQATAKVVVECL